MAFYLLLKSLKGGSAVLFKELSSEHVLEVRDEVDEVLSFGVLVDPTGDHLHHPVERHVTWIALGCNIE